MNLRPILLQSFSIQINDTSTLRMKSMAIDENIRISEWTTLFQITYLFIYKTNMMGIETIELKCSSVDSI